MKNQSPKMKSTDMNAQSSHHHSVIDFSICRIHSICPHEKLYNAEGKGKNWDYMAYHNSCKNSNPFFIISPICKAQTRQEKWYGQRNSSIPVNHNFHSIKITLINYNSLYINYLNFYKYHANKTVVLWNGMCQLIIARTKWL